MRRRRRPLLIAPGGPIVFPDPETADDEGLLAVGGDLSVPRLLEAYDHGIFPWYDEGLPPLWWSPDPRAVMDPAALHVSTSLRRVLRRPRDAAWERAALLVLFGGVTLTGVGSAWYHVTPTTATLVWDRLPMTLTFMPLLALVLGERVSERAGPWLLPLCLAAGVGSVVHWRLGEAAGAGDLRPYALAQFFPMLAIPLALALFPRRWIRGVDLLVALGWYALAKVFEAFDAPIYALGGVVSGHTLKHLAAAAGAAWLLRVVGSWRDRPEASRPPYDAGHIPPPGAPIGSNPGGSA